jgi:mannose-6-phosphate isomerase
VYEKYGEDFPLLIKFLDTTDWLSVQVHPGDELALKNHGEPFGKTEMWYVLQAGPKAELISGFNRKVDKSSFAATLQQQTLKDALNVVPVAAGDVFFIPSGRVHAIGGNILLAEIQQSSDITYRIYDWDRFDVNGLPRELHAELALDAIDFEGTNEAKSPYLKRVDVPVNLMSCPEFTTRLLDLHKTYAPNYHDIDSFVILLCTKGQATLQSDGDDVGLVAGEAVLIPAEIRDVTIQPRPTVELLEIYIG